MVQIKFEKQVTILFTLQILSHCKFSFSISKKKKTASKIRNSILKMLFICCLFDEYLSMATTYINNIRFLTDPIWSEKYPQFSRVISKNMHCKRQNYENLQKYIYTRIYHSIEFALNPDIKKSFSLGFSG